MLYWGGFSGSLIISRVYNRAVYIYLKFSVYVMLFLGFIYLFIHWNLNGFNHIKIGYLS